MESPLLSLLMVGLARLDSLPVSNRAVVCGKPYVYYYRCCLRSGPKPKARTRNPLARSGFRYAGHKLIKCVVMAGKANQSNSPTPVKTN